MKNKTSVWKIKTGEGKNKASEWKKKSVWENKTSELKNNTGVWKNKKSVNK